MTLMSHVVSGSLPYKTRTVIRRPTAQKRFSGTVIVDWIKVTGGTDLETLWPPAVPMPAIAPGGHPFLAAGGGWAAASN